MEIFIVGFTTFIAGLFSYYIGLSFTLVLIPVFSFFFPIEVSIFLSAIIHLLHYGYKYMAVIKHVRVKHLFIFSIISGPFAWLGAKFLKDLPDYHIFHDFTWGKSGILEEIVGFLFLVFVLFYQSKFYIKPQFNSWIYFPVGAIVGFVEGLCGLQTIIRKKTLQTTGLSEIQMMATGLGIGVLIDMSRITAYVGILKDQSHQFEPIALLIAFIFALIGVFLGDKYFRYQININAQKITRVAIGLWSVLFALGLI